jgi:hypothetical protein
VLRRPPPPAWLSAALSNLQPGLGRLYPQQLAGLAWALMVLRVAVPAGWWGAFLDACFAGGLVADAGLCAQVLFCVSSLDDPALQVRGGWRLCAGVYCV